MVNHKEKVKQVKELYDQCAITCRSNELSSKMAGQEEEDMHASRSTWLVREGREASTVEAPDPVLALTTRFSLPLLLRQGWSR